MPTSGLVISTSHVADLPAVWAALSERHEVTCGEPLGGRLPIVTETASKAEDQALWDWLWELPGVAAVDVAFIYLGCESPSASFEEISGRRTAGNPSPHSG
jgi:hypothetical protein